MSATARESVILVARPWRDTEEEALGYSPLSIYVERVWLAVLGPSSTWALRRLAADLVDSPDGIRVDLSELAGDLGLGLSTGPSSRIVHALDRLERFGLIARFDRELWVRVSVPPVSDRMLMKLSPGVRHAHETLTALAEHVDV